MQPNRTAHGRHDAVLIARHAAGDLADVERSRAEAQLAACTECSELRRDLVALTVATRSVPAPAVISRDFRLTADQAARLRRGSWLRALLRPFGSSGSPIRPMATAFTSLGVVGLVIGITLSSGMPSLGGAGSSAAEARDAATQGGEAPQAGLEYGPGESTRPVALGAGQTDDVYAQVASNVPVTVDKGSQRPVTRPGSSDVAFGNFTGGAGASRAAGGGKASEAQPSAPISSGPFSPMIAGSLGLLGIGLLLFGLRIASRRVR